jgi:hypothetical protein
MYRYRVPYLQKVISSKNGVQKFVKVNDENSRIRIQDPDPNPDPLVRGMHSRIRIHPKMSWIRNTAFEDISMVMIGESA